MFLCLENNHEHSNVSEEKTTVEPDTRRKLSIMSKEMRFYQGYTRYPCIRYT